ncbi:DNA cytosine methyltransferase, partial [Immundisolibacter sp.]|uniref:DNA cytosine methyltransferase n=1 Tax=Immundisolibacter sp. TaxID=1934948 RepID=UPI0035616F07
MDESKRVGSSFAIVDLFAGPGGLAEGFSSVTATDGSHPFRIALSVEKDVAAHSTLLLRSFLRQFRSGFPDEYYAFLNGNTTEPNWGALYPEKWQAATREALLLELGTPETERLLDSVLDDLRKTHGGNTILIGGPPCQAYSVVGRSRNRGVAGYIAGDDPRHFLYKEYIRILAQLRPAAFVMENVKGILSSSVEGARIFEHVLDDLRSADGHESYRLLALAPRRGWESGTFPTHPAPSDFLIHSEDFALPQARHRVIIIGIRRDIFDTLPEDARLASLLKPRQTTTNVEDVLDGMPKLRSGLSGKDDSPRAWISAIEQAVDTLLLSRTRLQPEHETLFRKRACQCADTSLTASTWPRQAMHPVGIGSRCPGDLRSWLLDPRLNALVNNETRAHMPSDLARYLFAAIHAEVTGGSPKAADFPKSLAPQHRNWTSGKFVDRFRVQLRGQPSTTVTSHIAKDGHYFIHPDPEQCRSLTVREAARLQTFPDNYF